MLSRSTTWRQGGILTQESAHALGIIENNISDRRAVVITHDCDLPNEKEEVIEVIVGSIIPKADSLFAHARHIRRLHLTYGVAGFTRFTVIELSYSGRRFIDKTMFAEVAQHDLELILVPEEKRSLKQWLAARYGRAAFPNVFQERLKKVKKLYQKLTEIFATCQTHLISVYFDLGEERSEDLLHGMPYYLRIMIVYNSVFGFTARKGAEECASKITDLFYKSFGDPSKATEVALKSCEAVADTHFSIADLRKVDPWPLEYLSLRETPTATFLAAGTTPI